MNPDAHNTTKTAGAEKMAISSNVRGIFFLAVFLAALLHRHQPPFPVLREKHCPTRSLITQTRSDLNRFCGARNTARKSGSQMPANQLARNRLGRGRMRSHGGRRSEEHTSELQSRR